MPPLISRPDINPQLCKVFNTAKHKWDKPWIVEPKFDGLRCWVVVDKEGKATPYSRYGKPLWNMQVVLEEIEEAGFQDYVLDGEVYTKDWGLSLSIVKTSTQDHPDMDKLHFHIWDCLLGTELRSTWTDARKVTHHVYSNVSNHVRKTERLWPWTTLKSEHVQVVPTRMVSSNEELQLVYTDFLTQKYEGAILKDPSGHYYGGRRSADWLKIKPWTDADLTIVGAYAGEGKHDGRIGGLILEGEAEWNGVRYIVHTECGTGFTDEEREYFQILWDSGKLNGMIVEIKFQDITADGSCRFPVYNRLREDKE